MNLTERETDILKVLVGIAGGRSESVPLATLVENLELSEDEVQRELDTLRLARLVWFDERQSYKRVQPDIKAVWLVREQAASSWRT